MKWTLGAGHTSDSPSACVPLKSPYYPVVLLLEIKEAGPWAPRFKRDWVPLWETARKTEKQCHKLTKHSWTCSPQYMTRNLLYPWFLQDIANSILFKDQWPDATS